MTERANIFSVGIGRYRCYSIVWYEESDWYWMRNIWPSWRKLGKGRYALDFGKLSLLLEKYSP